MIFLLFFFFRILLEAKKQEAMGEGKIENQKFDLIKKKEKKHYIINF